MSVSEKSDIMPNAAITAQNRTMSVGVSSTYARRRVTSGVFSNTLESNTDDQITSLDLGVRFPATKKKATRPKSAPVVRPDTLEMIMDGNRVIHSGESIVEGLIRRLWLLPNDPWFVFGEGGKPEYPEKIPLKHARKPTATLLT
jgi:hypothetical protein